MFLILTYCKYCSIIFQMIFIETNESNDTNLIHFISDLNSTWGCSENINFGVQVSQQFLDSMESGDSPTSLANLHNNEAGRVVRNY